MITHLILAAAVAVVAAVAPGATSAMPEPAFVADAVRREAWPPTLALTWVNAAAQLDPGPDPAADPDSGDELAPPENPTPEGPPPIIINEGQSTHPSQEPTAEPAPTDPAPTDEPPAETEGTTLETPPTEALPAGDPTATSSAEETSIVETPTAAPQEPPPSDVGERGGTMAAGLFAGTCAGGPVVRIVELNAPSVPEGEAQGSTAAVPVGTAFTLVERPFGDLLMGDQALVLYTEAAPQAVVACGAIGGVLDANGALSIGLVPVGDSGTVGIAYFGPENGGAATSVSLFVFQQP